MFQIFPLKDGLSSVEGIFCDGHGASLKPNGALDIGFIYSDTLCDVSAIFTANTFQAAPIQHFQKHNITQTNFILLNAKNANALTGDAGIEDIEEILGTLSQKFATLQNPIMSSTGVIGVRIPKEKILHEALKFDLSAKNSAHLAQAIMTTDSYPKEIAFEVLLEDESSFKIAGVAKGAGMINPSLATMLCFITTDANVPKEDMDRLLSEHAQTTFNAISVDGDTSTNDTVLLLSNKKSGVYDKEAFSQALRLVMEHLALAIVADGEGAKKMVAFDIKGAQDDAQAQIAAKALSDSLLVKTALFGEDPNWGRIASTIGASGVACAPERLVIAFEDVVVFDKGAILFTKEVEDKAYAVMQNKQFSIYCDLGMGEGSFRAYGCDLGYEYVKINAEYRT